MGFCVDESDDSIMGIDHLGKLLKNGVNWKQPRFDDIKDMPPIQILSCKVNGTLNKGDLFVIKALMKYQIYFVHFE